MKAISDINIRAKWDKFLGGIEVLEHNKETDQTYFRFNVNVPSHMQKREAVLVRKVLKDFPKLNETTIIQKSAQHARCPEDHKTSVRIQMRLNGMIIEDDSSHKGTKISWILANDLKGSLPNSMLYNMHINYQVEFMDQLSKACGLIVKGQLK